MKFDSLKSNRRFILLMMSIILPGLVISGLGLYSVSQQRKARYLNLREKYEASLSLIRTEIERQIETAAAYTFKQMSTSLIPSTLANQDALQNLMKKILLENPVVKYPFLINYDGSYIFPFTRKTTFLKAATFTPGNIIFKEAENFELKEKNYPEAIKLYLAALAKIKGNQNRFYINHAVARCYYKMNKFPQAAAYLSDILLTNTPGKDTSLYSLALYLAARVYKQMNLVDKAAEYYLRLYDEILRFNFDKAADKEIFAYFKNEALDYLLQHMKKQNQNNRHRFDRFRAVEGLDKLSELDIDVRWKYFNMPASESMIDEKGENTTTFYKLQEFYLPTDAKTLFYNEVKKLDLWTRPDTISLKNRPDIVYTRLPDNSGADSANSLSRELIFGFMISFDFIVSHLLPPIVKEHLADKSLIVTMEIKNKPTELTNPGEPGNSDKTFPIIRLPFMRISPNCFLVLSSTRDKYIESIVKKEMSINYALITAIICLLLLGIYFFYKYATAEADLLRLKSDFIDATSHTLKTPLTRIRLMAEKIALGWIKDETMKKEYCRAILSETDRMSEMVTNMLDFSKIESGRMRFDMKQGYLPEQVQAIMDSLGPHIENQQFQLKTVFADDIPPFYFDPEAIKSILVNLVQNALKYSKEVKYICVELYRKDDLAILSVTDKGMGIPVKEREKVFEKFYRVPDANIKAVEGSGLGLFLVRHAVNAHKGKIKITGGPGKGSIFKIYLPINQKKDMPNIKYIRNTDAKNIDY